MIHLEYETLATFKISLKHHLVTAELCQWKRFVLACFLLAFWVAAVIG